MTKTMIETFNLLAKIGQKATISSLSQVSGLSSETVATSLSLNLSNLVIDNTGNDTVFKLASGTPTQIATLRSQAKLVERNNKLAGTNPNKYLAQLKIENLTSQSDADYILRAAFDAYNPTVPAASRVAYSNTMTAMYFDIGSVYGYDANVPVVDPALFQTAITVLKSKGYTFIDDVIVTDNEWVKFLHI